MELILATFRDTAQTFPVIWKIFSYTWFLILPKAFYELFIFLWMKHIQRAYLFSLNFSVLELIPPRNIEKSPKLMESFYNALSGTDKGFSAHEKYIAGLLPTLFSLELVSEEGKIHFYIRTIKDFRNLVEANLYAQYPDMEINEVEDYTKKFPKILPNSEWELWGTDIEPTKKDVYPILTYQYFKEDVTGKMIDPLASVLEYLGKVGKDQHVWIQFLIAPDPPDWSKKEAKAVRDEVLGVKKPEEFSKRIASDFMDVISNIFSGIFGEPEFKTEAKTQQQSLSIEAPLTTQEKFALQAMEENAGKSFFRTKLRYIYLGKKEKFNQDKTWSISAFFGAFKQFADMNLNGFKPNNDSKTYSLYIATQPRMRYRQRKIYKRYLDRDPEGVNMHMSTAELATIFHFPDMSIVAPSVPRVEARRGAAPSNLPI